MRTKIRFILLLVIMSTIMGISSAMDNILGDLDMGGSKAQIISYSISTVVAGQYATLIVQVKNIGSDDYITVKANNPIGTFNTDRKFVKSGDTQTFTLSGQGVGGTNDETQTGIILADGTGREGDDTVSFEMIVLSNQIIPTKRSSGFDIPLSIISIITLIILRDSKEKPPTR